MMAMTQEQYKESGGLVCPSCFKSRGVNYGTVDIDTDTITLDCWCELCKAEWVEDYKLDGYRDLEVA